VATGSVTSARTSAVARQIAARSPTAPTESTRTAMVRRTAMIKTAEMILPAAAPVSHTNRLASRTASAAQTGAIEGHARRSKD
jgi:hypothetical protein